MGGKKANIKESPSGGQSDSPPESEESYKQNKKKQPIKKAVKPSTKQKKVEQSKKKQPQKKGSAQKKAPAKSKPKENLEKVTNQSKKKDFLPGQKYPTPDDEDGALAFYKSLYEKNSRSEMARKWCLEYGALEPQEAAKLLKEMGRGKK